MEGKILSRLFDLPYPIHTTDIILSAELEPEQREALDQFVKQGKLEVRTFSIEELIAIGELVDQTRLEAGEMSVLFHAREIGGIMLSGDGAFRKYVRQQGLKVHGTLWILDELVTHQILSPKEAHAALTLMLAQGSDRRLPKAECEKRLREWGSSS